MTPRERIELIARELGFTLEQLLEMRVAQAKRLRDAQHAETEATVNRCIAQGAACTASR